MHVLVTGGTGFIGSALCSHLLRRGDRVTVLSRYRNKARVHFCARLQVVETPDELNALAPPEAIINLAGRNLGSTRWTEEAKKDFVDSRVGVTNRLVAYMAGQEKARRPRVLISGSAVGYYGARGDHMLTERSHSANEYQSDLCRAWEQAARRAEPLGVRVCIMRSGAVLGPSGGPLASLVSLFRSGLGSYAGNGRQWLSWIHIRDWIDLACYLIGHRSLSGPFNATSPHPVRNREFAETLGRVLDRPVWGGAPAWLMHLLYGEMAHLYCTGQRVLPQRALDQGFQFRYPNLQDALQSILQPA